jgi:DNA-binding Lrp family transcriptional regulator
MSDGPEAEVVDLLGDEYVRTILTETRARPQSVDALSDACDADPSTIYRRVERLEEAGLLTPNQRLDPGGHHYKEYGATLEAVHVYIETDGYDIELDRTADEEPADRFTRLYEGFK